MKLSQAFPEVGDLDVTDDQLRGVQIAYKQFVNALRVEIQPPAPPSSPGAFFARDVQADLNRYGTAQVEEVRVSRLKEAFEKGDAATRDAIAKAAKIDLDVPVPADIAMTDVGVK